MIEGLEGHVRGIAVDSSDARLYCTEASGNEAIRRANLDGSQIEDVLADLSYWPFGIAIDPDARKLYWATSWQGPGIARANLDGSEVEGLVSSPDTPIGLALDAAGEKLYWTEAWYRGRVECANLDGSGWQVLADTGVSRPQGIAVDPSSGKLFWAHTGDIEKAELDGTGRETIVRGILAAPTEITLDDIEGRLYWADSTTDRIQRANVHGEDIETILRIHGSTPKGLALDTVNGHMYWSARYYTTSPYVAARLWRANLDGTDASILRSDSGCDPCSAQFGALAFDCGEGSLFYVDDYDCDDWLRRLHLDPSFGNAIISTSGRIHDVAVAPNLQLIYWAVESNPVKHIGASVYDGTFSSPVITFDTRYP